MARWAKWRRRNWSPAVIAAQNVDSAELVKILRPLMAQVRASGRPSRSRTSSSSAIIANNIRRLMAIIEEIDVADEDEIVLVQLDHTLGGHRGRHARTGSHRIRSARVP